MWISRAFETRTWDTYRRVWLLLLVVVSAAPAHAARPSLTLVASPVTASSAVSRDGVPHESRPDSTNDTRLRVLVCLDGVPFEMMDRLHADGFFQGFRPPARLISTFPAITEVMLTRFFQVEPPPGYGLRYYDKESNALRGGIGDLDAISVWFSLYDYVTPMFDRGLVYLWARAGDLDLVEFEKQLNDRHDGILMLHLDSTDALMHHERPAVTERWLRKLDRILSRVAAARDSAIEIVFFSDHGNDMTRSRRVPLEAHLKSRGWRPAGTLRGESGVAILPTGLISTGYLYTRRPAEVAAALVDMPGLDFAIFDSGSTARIEGSAGRAVIERWSGGDRWRYRPLVGDPLRLETVVATLRAQGKMDDDGWASDTDWFSNTVMHHYPDVLNRAWGGATGHVENVGDVLLSLKDGWHCGSRILSAMLTFQGTHGSLTRRSITGFWMSNRRDLESSRAEDALDRLGWRDIVESRAGGRGVAFRCADGMEADL